MNYFIWHHTGDKQETPKTMKGKNKLSEKQGLVQVVQIH
jgi:hypothetical protein